MYSPIGSPFLGAAKILECIGSGSFNRTDKEDFATYRVTLKKQRFLHKHHGIDENSTFSSNIPHLTFDENCSSIDTPFKTPQSSGNNLCEKFYRPGKFH